MNRVGIVQLRQKVKEVSDRFLIEIKIVNDPLGPLMIDVNGGLVSEAGTTSELYEVLVVIEKLLSIVDREIFIPISCNAGLPPDEIKVIKSSEMAINLVQKDYDPDYDIRFVLSVKTEGGSISKAKVVYEAADGHEDGD